MPHLRERHAVSIALRKLRFSPVLSIQGMRQTGKSVFVRDILKRTLKKIKYITLDKVSEKNFANANPESFLAQHLDGFPLAIDEAQKAPILFDTVKMIVDENRRPGMFILLGSTEFSKMTLIRESLTGRMSRLRIYPLNLAETCDIKANAAQSPCFANSTPRISRKDIMRYLARGGMPGIFATRDEVQRIALLEDWLALTLERDLQQIPKLKLNSDLARRLLVGAATVEEPTAGNLAKYVGVTLGKVQSYLDALSVLFVIQKVLPHPSGRGKAHYFLGDVSFASYFNASFARRLQTWLLQEVCSQISYRGEIGTNIYYYKGSRGGNIDLVIERRQSLTAIKLLATESLDERDLQGLLAWRKKEPRLKAFAFGGLRAKVHGIEIFPWEALA